MCSKEDIFKDSGPSHITAPNWNDPKDRRSVMASLVKGVKVLECDRQQKNKRSQAQAPAWWESFHFKLREQLSDSNTENPSIFGAVFEFMPPTTQHPPDDAPRFVIALRGTLREKDTIFSDMKYDWHLLLNKLQNLYQSPRYQRVLSCANDFVQVDNYHKVWLAGHSLGAAIALLVGKEMTRNRSNPLETYLFNPPFVTLSLEPMKISDKFKQFIGLLITVGRGILAQFTSEHGNSGSSSNEAKDDPFDTLKEWQPHLFLNSKDFICCGYIGYFRARKVMRKVGILRDLEKLATQNTVIRTWLLGEWHENQEPIHLLASAKLNINKKRSSILESHGIQQWWNPGLKLKCKSYQY